MQWILASTSPYRKAQLEAFGLKFIAVKPLVDEEELKRKGPTDLVELTRYLAGAKATSLRAQYPEAILIGSDQLVEFAGQRLDKPGSSQAAIAQLTRLQGQSHRLITSLTVSTPSASHSFTDITSITLRPLSKEQIEAYVILDKPHDCAGSYKIERAGLALVENISGRDPSAIQGLPLMSLTEAIYKLKISWAEVWPPQEKK